MLSQDATTRIRELEAGEAAIARQLAELELADLRRGLLRELEPAARLGRDLSASLERQSAKAAGAVRSLRSHVSKRLRLHADQIEVEHKLLDRIFCTDDSETAAITNQLKLGAH